MVLFDEDANGMRNLLTNFIKNLGMFGWGSLPLKWSDPTPELMVKREVVE